MANDITELRQTLERNVKDETKPWAPVFKFLEDTTGIDRLYIFWGFAVFTLLWLAFGYAGQLVCNLIGTLYPAYASIHAIESSSSNDDTKWLTYWVVFSAFSFVEYFAEIIAGWFPFYWMLKCVFFIWLMIPTNLNGSIILYRNVIKPYFLQYHSAVDDVLNKAQTSATGILEKNK